MNPNNLTSTNTGINLNTSGGIFFNNYLQPTFSVSSNVNDAIIGYFEKIAQNKESAKIMASAVIYTSLAQRVDPMAIMDKFRVMDQEEMNTFVSMFLNLNRVGTSYLGIHSRPKISKYVQRAILP